MKERSQEPVLVVLQLSGGNDFMNTLIPYSSGDYYDARPTVAIPQKDVLPIDDTLGFHPSAGPLKELYDKGKMAIVQGIGYPNSIRSHFRAMDIWHTCEPHEVGTEGWVAKAIRELDPRSENVLTCVSLGKGLPRAVVASGVPVTSVDNLEAYGVMTGIAEAGTAGSAGDFQAHVHARRWGAGGYGLSGQYRVGRAEGYGHAQEGPGGVRVQR